MFSIVISEKGGAERREAFEQAQVTVGRVQGNDLMLPKGNVSKRHCLLEQRDGQFSVTDQNSTNGTYVNRRRIAQSTPVREGDRIYVGDFVLRIETAQEPKADHAIPSTTGQDSPPRAPMLTSPDAERSGPSGALGVSSGGAGISSGGAPGGSAAAAAGVSSGGAGGPRSTPETTSDRSKGSRDSDSNAEFAVLLSALGALVQRVTAALELRALDRDVDTILQRRVERLVDDAFNELVIEGEISSSLNEARVKAAAVDELVKFGPLGRLLDDPSVQEIAISGVGHIAVVRGGQRATHELPFSVPSSIPRVVLRLRREAPAGQEDAGVFARVTLSKWNFDLETLPSSALPGGAALRLIRREHVSRSLEDLVRSGVISRTMATFLRHCVTARVNILVVGPTRSGASEVLSALCAAAEGDRVFALSGEESFGATDHNVTRLSVSEDNTLSVLRAAANFAGHRVLIDGLSGVRASAALAVIGEGAQGVLMRAHARSIERGLNRWCAELSLRQPGVTPFVVAEALIAAFDIVLEVARLPDGRSRVVRIAELERGDVGLVKGSDIFDFAIERTATGGSIEGTFRATGHSPQVSSELKSHGIRIDLSLFSRPPTSD